MKRSSCRIGLTTTKRTTSRTHLQQQPRTQRVDCSRTKQQVQQQQQQQQSSTVQPFGKQHLQQKSIADFFTVQSKKKQIRNNNIKRLLPLQQLLLEQQQQQQQQQQTNYHHDDDVCVVTTLGTFLSSSQNQNRCCCCCLYGSSSTIQPLTQPMRPLNTRIIASSSSLLPRDIFSVKRNKTTIIERMKISILPTQLSPQMNHVRMFRTITLPFPHPPSSCTYNNNNTRNSSSRSSHQTTIRSSSMGSSYPSSPLSSSIYHIQAQQQYENHLHHHHSQLPLRLQNTMFLLTASKRLTGGVQFKSLSTIFNHHHHHSRVVVRWMSTTNNNNNYDNNGSSSGNGSTTSGDKKMIHEDNTTTQNQNNQINNNNNNNEDVTQLMIKHTGGETGNETIKLQQSAGESDSYYKKIRVVNGEVSTPSTSTSASTSASTSTTSLGLDSGSGNGNGSDSDGSSSPLLKSTLLSPLQQAQLIEERFRHLLYDQYPGMVTVTILILLLSAPFAIQQMKKNEHSVSSTSDLSEDPVDTFVKLARHQWDSSSLVLPTSLVGDDHDNDDGDVSTTTNEMKNLLRALIVDVFNSKTLQESATQFVVQIVTSEQFQVTLSHFVKQLWNELITDPDTIKQVVHVLEIAIQDPKIKMAFQKLILQLVDDPQVKHAIIQLIQTLGKDPVIQQTTVDLLIQSAHTTLTDPDIFDHSMEFASEVVGDDFVQRTAGEALRNTVGHAFIKPVSTILLTAAGVSFFIFGMISIGYSRSNEQEALLLETAVRSLQYNTKYGLTRLLTWPIRNIQLLYQHGTYILSRIWYVTITCPTNVIDHTTKSLYTMIVSVLSNLFVQIPLRMIQSIQTFCIESISLIGRFPGHVVHFVASGTGTMVQWLEKQLWDLIVTPCQTFFITMGTNVWTQTLYVFHHVATSTVCIVKQFEKQFYDMIVLPCRTFLVVTGTNLWTDTVLVSQSSIQLMFHGFNQCHNQLNQMILNVYDKMLVHPEFVMYLDNLILRCCTLNPNDWNQYYQLQMDQYHKGIQVLQHHADEQIIYYYWKFFTFLNGST